MDFHIKSFLVEDRSFWSACERERERWQDVIIRELHHMGVEFRKDIAVHKFEVQAERLLESMLDL